MRPSTRMVVLDSRQKYVLDFLSVSSAAAYGLRKLTRNYNGFCIRVRRSLDNNWIDIGFDSQGSLDLLSLMNFVGAGTGFVVIWYDQSGNGNHATQSTSNAQPRIIVDGMIIYHQGKETIFFDGFDNYLRHTLNLVGESTISIVANSFGLRPNMVASAVFTATPANTRIDNMIYSTLPYLVEWGSFAGAALSSGFSVNSDYTILESVSNNPPTGTLQIYTNGNFSNQQSGRYAGDFQVRQSIGAEHDFGGNHHYGYIAEITVFSSALSTQDRQLLRRNQGNRYGITVA